MFYLEKENSPGIAVFVDFRKAFDTIEWIYLEKTLALFNFGPNFLQWFKTIYSKKWPRFSLLSINTWSETRVSTVGSSFCYWS